MSDRPEPKEVPFDTPPALVAPPSYLHHTIEVDEGEGFDLDLSVYNIGYRCAGLGFYVVGEAVSNHYIGADFVEAAFGDYEDIEAAFSERDMGGATVYEGRLWPDTPFGEAPPWAIPAGLTLRPPFLIKTTGLKRWSERFWEPRRIYLTLCLTALSPGRTSAEVWIVPPDNPTEGVILQLDLHIKPV